MHHEYCAEGENLCHSTHVADLKQRRSPFSLPIQVYTRQTLHLFFTISLTPLILLISVVVNSEKFVEPYVLMSKTAILKMKYTLSFHSLCLDTSGFPPHPVSIR